jgi:hypothetical protein
MVHLLPHLIENVIVFCAHPFIQGQYYSALFMLTVIRAYGAIEFDRRCGLVGCDGGGRCGWT